ncbi:MAG: glucose-6-phosphate isomerase, partial [Woeseiaceae bacterium]
MLFDYSKNRVSTDTMKLLTQLAKDCDLQSWIDKMFNGEKINHTEQRAVFHVALRSCPPFSSKPMKIDGKDVMPEVCSELKRVKILAESIRSRSWLGVRDQPITDVVNIGIGGSHLGPLMATEALRPYALHDLNIHYVCNI